MLTNSPDTGVDYRRETDEIFRELIPAREQINDPDEETSRLAKRRVDRLTTQLIELHYGLVASYTRRFTRNTTKDMEEELLQSGLVGLVKAINTFDPDKGVFSSWAVKPIKREVLSHLHKSEFQTLIAADFERRAKIMPELHKQFPTGDQVDISAVAAALGMSDKQVSAVVNPVRLSSIHSPLTNRDDSGSTLEEMLPDRSVSVEDQVATQQLVRSMQVNGLTYLDPRERYVIVRRFGLDSQPEQKLTEIGQDMDLSREAIRQIQAKALAKLAHPSILAGIVRAHNV